MRQSNVLQTASFLCAAAIACFTTSADTLESRWQIAPGDKTWLTTGNTERGLAYNAITKHLLVVSRAGGLSVRILNGATGEEILTTDDPPVPKTLNVTGISGGTFAASMIGVSDDGVIYAANLTTGSIGTPFKVYRWANEDAEPVLAYEGDPGGGDANADRWGDSFDVRGGGLNTQWLAGTSDASQKMAVFTTVDGENFTHTTITNAANTAGAISVAFGTGNTGWSKRPGSSTPLRQFSFDLATGAATFLRSFDIAPIASIGFSAKYFGGVAIETAPTVDNARVYDVSDLTAGPILVGKINFPADNANGNAVGSVDFGDGMAFFLDTNGGLIGAAIIESITPVSISTHPANITVIETGKATLSVSASGSPPLQYRWFHGETLITNATTSTLTITNASNADAGQYTVEVSNASGPILSNPATVTVTPIVRGSNLTLKWKRNTGSYSWLSDDGTARGIAYNPATGHVLVVSRTGALAIHVLNAQTGAEIMNGEIPLVLNLDPSIVTGASPAEFRINMIGVAEDGAIYAANLTTGSGSSPFKVYRWDNEGPDTIPYPVYVGDPSAGQTDPAPDKRFGDSFDVRRSGEDTEILVASRNGNVVALIKPNADFNAATATVIHVPDAPNGSFGLTIAFGSDNSFFGAAPATATRLVNYDIPPEGAAFVTGTIAKTFPAAFQAANLAFDSTNSFLAGNALETPDNVRLYQLKADLSTTFLDQELYDLDAANPNGTGSLDFGGGMLFAIDTNNGIMAFDVSNAVAATAATLASVARQTGGTVTFTVTGAVGATYTVQSANNLTPPITWDKVADVTIGATGAELVTDAAAASQSMRFYRAIAP